MSLTSDSTRTEQVATGAPSGAQCEHCRAPLAQDQEWCIECGTARTMIHSPPSWRLPAAVIAIVVALVLAAFAIALINLSSEANRSTAATPPASTADSGARH